MLFSKVLSEGLKQARLAQSVERQALNLVVGGSSPPVGDSFFFFLLGFLLSLSYWVSYDVARVGEFAGIVY